MNWDNEIDEVARQMTAGEPDAGFRARVIARLDREGATDTRSAFLKWAPVAAMAIVIGAVVIAVRPFDGLNAVLSKIEGRLKPDPTGDTVRPKTDPTYATATTDPGRRTVETTAAKAGTTTAPSQERAEPGARRPARSTSQNGARFAARRPGDGVAFSAAPSELAPEPLAIDAIDVESMEAMESLAVPRLAVAELDLPAIGE